MKISKLFVLESVIVLGLAAVITQSLVLSSNTMHFQRMLVNFYADKSVDFSADVTTLVRSLGIVSLMTLVFGLTIGSAMALTTTRGSGAAEIKATATPQLDQYENAIMDSGMVKITKTEKGTTYQLTDLGRRFLREYEYLLRNIEEPKPTYQES